MEGSRSENFLGFAGLRSSPLVRRNFAKWSYRIIEMDAMSKTLASIFLIWVFLVQFGASYNGYESPRCNCEDDEGFLSIERQMEYQRVSDIFIALAYFSIPIELLYFVSSSNVPYKWMLFQFIAFIVLCGMTHLLNGWTYGPHTIHLVYAVTTFKMLTALVAFTTVITLSTLIPLLLKVKVREFMLKKKTWDLAREVGIIKKQKEAGLHVRMLSQEIRKSLDRHKILYTTLDKLSEVLDLQNCAIWTPNESQTMVNLTHELKDWDTNSLSGFTFAIPTTDPDVITIKGSAEVEILDPSSTLAAASSQHYAEPGAVAAIRMPMLRVRDFTDQTPELMQACYVILVSVLPSGQARSWGSQECEILKAVADQVAVALSHAAVLEESQLMTEKLAALNQALLRAKREALMASQARVSFQMMMEDGMRRPMHSITGLVSLMQDECLNTQQKLIVASMAKTCNVLSFLINDVMDSSSGDNEWFSLEMRSFHLCSMIKEAACISKCLLTSRGSKFALMVENSLPDFVIGDERRVVQVILHMVGNLLNVGGCLTLMVSSESGNSDPRRGVKRPSVLDGYVFVKFEVGINMSGPYWECSSSTINQGHVDRVIEERLGFSMCQKLVQMMQGNVWVVPNPVNFDRSMVLVLQFQICPSNIVSIMGSDESLEHPYSDPLFRGLNVLLAEGDIENRAVTRKLLEKLGCNVTAVASGEECLDAIVPSSSTFEVLLLGHDFADVDVFELTLRIRMSRGRSWPLILALAAKDGDHMCEKYLQIGMNGVIRKPVLLPGIAAELKRVLS